MLWKNICLAALGIAALSVSHAGAQDIPTINLARQTAAEENLWLMLAKPELAPNLGKAYKLEWSQFRASDPTFKAYEGGQIHFGTVSANAAVVAASKGVDFKMIASLSLESSKGSRTPYLVREDGPKTLAELKGKTIGINGYRSSIELWGRAGVIKGGLNPDRDVNWAVVPFPAMGEALRAGKIDLAGLPQVFADGEMKKGGLRELFTSKTGVPFDEELIVLIGSPAFMKKYPDATKAFLSDLVTVNKIYLKDVKAARQALLDAKLLALPPDILFNLVDYLRDPDMKINVEALEKQQDLMLQQGYQEKKINIKDFVDQSLMPKG